MNIAVLLTQLPLQGMDARESLDLIFALAAVDHQVTVIFTGDAVYQLIQADDSAEVWTKDFRRSFKLFELYDIEQLYVCAESLRQRGLQLADLSLQPQAVEADLLNQLLSAQQHLIRA